LAARQSPIAFFPTVTGHFAFEEAEVGATPSTGSFQFALRYHLSNLCQHPKWIVAGNRNGLDLSAYAWRPAPGAGWARRLLL